ncbi:hypothetical protein Tdes44962_MAKER10234 [Teratosphaeria destructans]|uniref:Uncharacterized protein n=1 Tax=Teratosphaeria destructans TaxID=418781 RepID=A0A9W7W0F0_9PEZI|nr:hypothetical protein Tdes44962_MAKER10234 [Teratosphaeria destructans]
MATTQARRSKSHCHGSAIIVTPLQTQPPYSYSLSPSKSVELCPPHWRLPPRRSWRQKLKGLVLTAPPVQPDGRPRMKRMKDSDDYITARAANPWTGQISPSIRSPRSAKCLPATPDSPGDALNLPEPRPPAPPPEPPLRPVIQGATSDERRKISAGSLQRCRQGCVSATVPTAVAPEQTHSTAGADATSGGDRFILHMPSAREPQPFAYPGRSPADIERLQHLTHTGIESNERLLRGERWHDHASRPSGGPHHHEPPSGCDLRETSWKQPWKPSGQFRTAAQQQHQDRRGVPPRPGRNLSGCPLERTAGDIHGAHGTPSMSRGTPDLFDLPRPADLCAATVARVALFEPQTPAGAKHLDGTDSSPGGLAVDGAVRPTVQAPASSTVRDVSNADETSPPPQRAVRPRVIPRKPVGVMDSAPRRLERDGDYRRDTGAETHEHQQGPGRAISDLSQLPRVRLVHPALASLPPRQRTWSRPCSLGCETAPATGQCTTQRRTSASSIAGPHPPGHLSTDGAEEEPRVPSSIDTRDLHALISLGGHVLACLTALTVAWKVGTALAMAIDALLWPFVVPLQIMRWLAGGD